VDSLNQFIGILGGSFDPIHFGHLRLAQEAVDFLGLSEVRFVPAGRPPHRGPPQVADEHRLAMLQLALQGNSGFRVDPRELGATEPTYTIDTLSSLRNEIGTQTPLVLFIGADQFMALHTWRRWQALTDLAHILVAMRPSAEPFTPDGLTPEVSTWFRARWQHQPDAIRGKPGGSVLLLGLTPLAISSTAIRSAIAEHRSPRYLLPDPVLDYIRAHNLYVERRL
jgi:nicotinate-nucleotide adenylyltransferase